MSQLFPIEDIPETHRLWLRDEYAEQHATAPRNAVRAARLGDEYPPFDTEPPALATVEAGAAVECDENTSRLSEAESAPGRGSGLFEDRATYVTKRVRPPLIIEDSLQPMPVDSGMPDVTEICIELLRQRREIGIKTYGKTLTPFDGRSTERDATEELVDALQYLVKHTVELETILGVVFKALDQLNNHHTDVHRREDLVMPLDPLVAAAYNAYRGRPYSFWKAFVERDHPRPAPGREEVKAAAFGGLGLTPGWYDACVEGFDAGYDAGYDAGQAGARDLAERCQRLEAENADLQEAQENAWANTALVTREVGAELTRLGEENARQRARIAALEAALGGLLAGEEEACRLDHHGNCQAHRMDNPCSVQAARAALEG